MRKLLKESDNDNLKQGASKLGKKNKSGTPSHHQPQPMNLPLKRNKTLQMKRIGATTRASKNQNDPTRSTNLFKRQKGNNPGLDFPTIFK